MPGYETWIVANTHQWGAVAISFLFFYYAAFGCTWGMVWHYLYYIGVSNSFLLTLHTGALDLSGGSQLISNANARGCSSDCHQLGMKKLESVPAVFVTSLTLSQLFAFVCTQFTSTGIRNLGYKFYISKSDAQQYNVVRGQR